MFAMSTTKRQLLAEAVRETRKSRGITQAQLAKSAGVHAQTIGNLERGTHDTSPDSIKAIGRALGVDLTMAALVARQTVDMIRTRALERLATLPEADQLRFTGALHGLVISWEPPSPGARAVPRPRGTVKGGNGASG